MPRLFCNTSAQVQSVVRFKNEGVDWSQAINKVNVWEKTPQCSVVQGMSFVLGEPASRVFIRGDTVYEIREAFISRVRVYGRTVAVGTVGFVLTPLPLPKLSF